MVILMHVGFMMSAPMARDLTAVLARERHVATHMGVVGTMGGIGVLISSTITGWLLEFTNDPSILSIIPWVVCMLFPIVSAIAIAYFPFPEGVDDDPKGKAATASPGAAPAATTDEPALT